MMVFRLLKKDYISAANLAFIAAFFSYSNFRFSAAVRIAFSFILLVFATFFNDFKSYNFVFLTNSSSNFIPSMRYFSNATSSSNVYLFL